MKSVDEIGITFANAVVGRGIFNNVVNITLGVFQWTPTDEAKIDPDLVITSRLRLDLPCAKQLRDALNSLFTQVENQPVTVTATNGADHDERAQEKIN